jgi:hypothetical protein
MGKENSAFDVTGDKKWATTVEHRMNRPVAWAEQSEKDFFVLALFVF